MDKLKTVFSGHRKSTDAAGDQTSPIEQSHRMHTGGLTGEGSHLASASQALNSKNAPTAGNTSDEYHPIYDQFTGHSASGEPTKTTDQAPHFSNTTDLNQTSQSTTADSTLSGKIDSTPSSSLRPGTDYRSPGHANVEGISTASIKSGVLGFPQGGSDSHAALENRPQRELDATQTKDPSDLPDRTIGERKNEPHLSKAAALEAGSVGAATGMTARELIGRHEENPPTEQSHALSSDRAADRTTEPSYQQSKQEPNVSTDTDRSFPLVGGVTSRKAAEKPSTTETSSTVAPASSADDRSMGTKVKEFVGLGATTASTSTTDHTARGTTEKETVSTRASTEPTATTNERSLGTKEKEALGVGATTAPVSTTHGRVLETENKEAAGVSASTAPTSSVNERAPGTKEKEAGISDGREALAGAAAAGVATTAASSAPREHDHSGYGHKYDGPRYVEEKSTSKTGPFFTEGPHVTDTANRTDPHLHIPGEFPDPTPIEESSQPTYGATSRQADITPSVPAETSTKDHHHGRDAAITGGAGAAGLGAYEAGKHHQRETADVGNEPYIEATTNPYSSQKLDPRVSGEPRGLVEQKFDPIAKTPPSPHDSSKEHHGRDTPLAGGLAGGAGVAGYEALKDRPKEHEKVQPSPTTQSQIPSTQHQITQSLSQSTEPSKQEHHYNRDAVLAGGVGGAGLAGYEASKGGPSHTENVQPATSKQQASSTQQQTNQELSQSTEPPKQEHHYGHDAAVAGALVTGGAGTYAYSQRDEKDSGPASSTIGPHKSNVANIVDPRVQPDPALQKHHEAGPTPQNPASATVGPHKSNVANVVDPRVQPVPEKQKGHTATGPHESDTLNRLDPKVDSKAEPETQHHYGRDAALAGGTGVAGYGAYEAANKYDQHRSTQPSAAMEEQRYDPTAQGAHDPNQAGRHHYGRDAAVAGTLGAAGAGGYAYSQRDQNQPTQAVQSSGNQQVYTQQPTGAYQQPSATQEPTGGHQRYDSVQDPSHQQHQKRDAAAAAGVAGAAGVGGYEYSKHEAEKAEKERLAQQQRDFEAKQKEQEKAFKHQQKEIEKQRAKDQKEHSKLVAAEDKKHQKEVERQEKEHQKEVEKREAQQQKELEKEEEPKEKKHHLFGFLHRDKKPKEPGEPDSPRQSKESPRTSKEYAGLGAAGAAGVGTTAAAYAYEAGHDSDGTGKHERNRLHKDPPKGHPAREALEHQHQHEGPGIHQHVGIDGPINRPGEISGDHETRKGVYGAHPIGDEKRTVTEPHTGLPMNIEQYGNGHGGLDGSKTVEGYHQVPGAGNENAGQQHGVTDWEAIKKANTPY